MDSAFESTGPDDLRARLLEHREWLERLARELVRDPVEADDVAQDAWLSALERPPRRTLGLRPWLTVVVRRLILVSRRGRARRRARDERAARPEATPSTADLIERMDAAERLARELVALEEPYRTTLLLRFIEGLGAVEIARRTGVPAGTVRWRTKRGLDELRERLERDFGGESALGCVLARLAEPARSPSLAALIPGAGITAWLAVGAFAAGTVALVALTREEQEALERDVVQGAAAAVIASATRTVAAPTGTGTILPVDAGAGRIPLGTGAGARGAEPPADLARIRILDSDGLPHAKRFAVLLPTSGEALSRLETDEQGWLELPAGKGPRELAIDRSPAFPHRARIDLAPGERELVLPEGEVLEGHIVVDGSPPPRPVELEIYPASFAYETPFTDEDPARALQAQIARTNTDEAGRFLVRGLEPGRGYGIQLADGHVHPGTREGGNAFGSLARFFVPRPARGLVFEVERLPSVAGRILEVDGRTSAGAIVACVVTRGDGTGFYVGTQADEQGRFEFFLDGPWRALELEIWGTPGQRGKRSLSFAREDAGLAGDLGDLQLAHGRTVCLRVIEPDGRPIAGARTSSESVSTDERGETTVSDLTASTIRVAAPGFATVEVGVSDENPLVVVLPPAPELALQVHAAGEKPLAWIDIELSSARLLFVTNDGMSPSTILSEARRGSFLMGEATRARFHADARGELTVDSLNAGVPLELRLLVRGEIVHSRELAALGQSERRRVRIDLDRELVVLRGRVVDEAGEPLAGACVPLRSADSEAPTRPWQVESDSDGRFSAVLLDPHDLDFVVSKRGYRSRAVRLPRVTPDEIEVVLERGRELEVLVQDPSGTPVRGARVRATRAGREERDQAEPTGAGSFEFLGLEDGPCVIEVDVGGGKFRQPSDGAETQLVICVPAMGALEASWDVPTPQAGTQVRIELSSTERDRSPLQQTFFDLPCGSCRFDPVLSGDYELALKIFDGNAESVWERRALALAAGQTTRVRLSR